MKVLQIVDSLDPGGTERMAVNLAGGLAEAGVESHLCVSRHCGPLASALPTTISAIVLNRRWRFDWRAVARLRAYVVRRQITHIHAHSTSVALGWLSRFNRNCRLLWHVHTGAPQEVRGWQMRLGVTSDHICCASEAVAHFIRSRFPLDPRRVTVLPNAVPVPRNDEMLAEPLPGEKGYRMVCVANLRREKDHLTLLHAFAEFAKSYPAWVLLLVGNEPDKNLAKNLRRIADELSVADRVHFLGTRNDVGAILQNCEIGVLSSICEAFPVTLLEYGAAGLPVIATAVGEVPHILRNCESGYLIPPASPRELAERMSVLADNTDLRRTMGAALQKHVQETYSLGKLVTRLVRIYKSMQSPLEIQDALDTE